MNRLAFLANRHDVEIRDREMPTHACLTVYDDDTSLLSVSTAIDQERRLPAMATMLHVAELRWPGDHFRMRFPLAEDGFEMRKRVDRERRDYRIPYKLGLRSLMPDGWLLEMERDQVEDRDAAERAGVSPEDFRRRVRDWRIQRGVHPEVTILDIEEFRQRDDLPPMPAAPIPAPSWKKGPKPNFQVVLAAYQAQHPQPSAEVADGPIPF